MSGSEEEVQTQGEGETIIPDKSVELWTVVKGGSAQSWIKYKYTLNFDINMLKTDVFLNRFGAHQGFSKLKSAYMVAP